MRPNVRCKFDEIFEAIAAGNAFSCAWRSYGMSDTTFYAYTSPRSPKYDPEIRAAYEQARAKGQCKMLKTIMRSPQATLNLLARSDPAQFGRWREESIDLELYQETRNILLDKEKSAQEKFDAILEEFYQNNINLQLTERLLTILRMRYPELDNSVGSATNPTHIAILPDNKRTVLHMDPALGAKNNHFRPLTADESKPSSS